MQLSHAYDHKIVEEEVTKHWEKHWPAIKKTTQFNPKKPVFSFLEGPPTANAPPGLHHMEVRIFKDVMCRFKYMQGYNVARKGGWDCHGLPVEVQVEKKLGLKTKKDVLKYGIAEFNKVCREDVFTFIKDWEVMTKRLAYWIDLDDPYRTLDNSYIESVWWSLKELFKKKMLYEGHKVVPYCPRCETALSSHEVALGYNDVTENTITVKLKQKGTNNRYFLAWTTTPWTLPSNMCLAVNPKISYVVVSDGDDEYVLAKDRAEHYFKRPNIIKEFKGIGLVGIEYEPIFDYFVNKLDKPAWRVVSEDYVTTEDGTGIVHQAPAFGEVDYESCKNHNLPFVQPVASDGTFTDDVSDFKGLFVKAADPKIIQFLDKRKALFKTEKYTHSYPFCWRCSTPLLYYAMISWFISVSKIRDKLVENNKKIIWFPDHIKEGRFGKWLEGAKDWALSRSKFWGTPLPIWRCECGKTEAIGSIEELKKRSTNVLKNLDLHKPYVDELKLVCSCGKKMSRIPDVIDCWYDSGAAIFAQHHYPFENKEIFEKQFPYDFIAEAIDQTRGWFYTLLVLSTLLFDNIAYKRCAVGGLLCDDKGEKMSKSKGNILNPKEMFDQVGVDAVRILMCSYPFGENIKFGISPMNDVVLPFLRVLWNSYYFAHEFLDMQQLHGVKKPGTLLIEDEWLISKINTLVKSVQENLDNGQYNHAITKVQDFVNNDFSRGYIKLIRDRAQQKDEALAYTFKYVFERLLKIIAPFAPYISEFLFQHAFKGEESIHFTNLPKIEAQDETLEQDMTIVQDIISAVLQAREKAKLTVRWPAKEIIVVSTDENVKQAVERLNLVLSSQTNIKLVNVTTHFDEVKIKIEPLAGIIGKDFGKLMPEIIKELQKKSSIDIASTLAREGKISVKVGNKEITLTSEHIKVNRVAPEKYAEGSFSQGFVYLDTSRTSELDAEGYAREIMRRVQAARKKAGLKKADQITLVLQTDEELKKLLFEWSEAVQQKCGAVKINITAEKTSRHPHEVVEEKIKDKAVLICFEKV